MNANELARLFEDAGFHLYLVGGVVRDALLDRLSPDSDLDFTTDALPTQTEQILASWADSHLDAGQALWHHRRCQGRTARRGHHSPGRGVRRLARGNPTWSSRPPSRPTCRRRDFTVNAMALSLPDLALVDPFDGVADLAARRLSTPLSGRTCPSLTTPCG